MGRVIDLNLETIRFFCLPHLVEMCAFKILSVCFGLEMVTFIYCEKLNFES